METPQRVTGPRRSRGGAPDTAQTTCARPNHPSHLVEVRAGVGVRARPRVRLAPVTITHVLEVGDLPRVRKGAQALALDLGGEGEGKG